MTTENQAPEETVPPVEGTPSPAPAPQAPVQLDLNAPAPVAPPVAPPPAEPAPATFDPTGDPKMDVALAFFAKAGMKPDSPSVVAAQAGDFSLLKAELSAAGKPGWQEHVALAEASFQEASAAATAIKEKSSAAVLSVFDSPDQWNEVRTWAAGVADDAEKAQINAMFAAGPVAAKAAAMYLKQQFAAAGNVVAKTAPPAVAPNRSAPAPATGGTLTKQQFAQEVQELVRTKGSRVIDEAGPEYMALVRRRQAHRD